MFTPDAISRSPDALPEDALLTGQVIDGRAGDVDPHGGSTVRVVRIPPGTTGGREVDPGSMHDVGQLLGWVVAQGIVGPRVGLLPTPQVIVDEGHLEGVSRSELGQGGARPRELIGVRTS